MTFREEGEQFFLKITEIVIPNIVYFKKNSFDVVAFSIIYCNTAFLLFKKIYASEI